MTHSVRARKSRPTSSLNYEAFEPRNMLATISVGDLNSGVAVSEDATGIGYILYSQEDVHTRFSGIRADNADQFIAVRLDGIQWQYNDDSQWVDFQTETTDVLVAKVNFDGDAVVLETQFYVQGVQVVIPEAFNGISGEPVFEPSDLYVVANQFGSQFDKNEFQVLGSQFQANEFPVGTDLRQANISLIQRAAYLYEAENSFQEFFELANFDSDGNPLLSWRVHLLPYLGYDNLYQQFNLDEPWNSPHNLAIADQMPDVFSSPNFDSSNRTPYLASAGENSTFKLDGPATDVFREDSVAFVEVDASHAVVWTQPVDWYFNEADPLAGLGNASEFYRYQFVSTLGGSSFVTDQIDPVNFANFVTTGEGSLIDYRDFNPSLSGRTSLNRLVWAALDFESANQYFPAQSIKAEDGTPLLSWRVAILPFLGENELYQRFNLDEAWDSPHNIQLLEYIPRSLQHADVEHGKTVFLGLDGEGAVFDADREGREINFGSITDGSTNTILFVEADVSQAVEWSRPVDLNYDAANPTNGLGGITGDGTFNAVLADGNVVSFDASAPALLDAWATFNGGEINDESILADGFTRFAPVEDQLRQLTLASLNFESSHMQFPRSIFSSDSGTSNGPDVPLLSWRVAILPFIEQGNLYSQFRLDEPWDSPHNLSLLPLMPQIFATEGVENGKTVFQGAHGDNTFFSNDNRGTRFGSFEPQSTAAILQVNSDQAIEWTKPGDFDFDPANLQTILGDATASGFHFSLADGTVHFFNKTISDDVLNKILSPADFADLALDLKVFREDSRIQTSSIEVQNKLRNLSLATHQYESSFQRFPQHAIYSEPLRGGGEPLLSWRVELLPFLGENELYHRFNLDEPWDSPHNLSLLPLMPEVFKLPGVEDGKTALQAITSEFNSSDDPRTIFPLGNQVRTDFHDILDGSSNTLLFAEVDAGLAVEWTKPQDIVYNPNDPAAGLATGTPFTSTAIALADGSTRTIPSNLKEDIWRELVLANDGGFADLRSPSSFNSGTIVPAGDFGTAGDDTFSLTVVGDTVEVSVNGATYTLDADDVGHMVFNGLGGTDTFTFDVPDRTDLTFVNGAFQVGDLFTVVVDNFDVVNLEDRALSVQGDVDLDDSVTFADIPSFISVLINGDYQLEADINQDGVVDFEDIAAFIDVLKAQ